MRLTLLLLVSSACWANTCTPYTVSANASQYPWPAFGASGVGYVGYSTAQVLWTSDLNPVPPTAQQILYSTDAYYTANPTHRYNQQMILGPSVDKNGNGVTPSSSYPQGNNIPNLLPSTLYHFLGQSFQATGTVTYPTMPSSGGTGSWCTASDQTFTTLAQPASQVYPTLPSQLQACGITAQTTSEAALETCINSYTSAPAMNGTHWVYGSNCGLSGTVTQKVQNCFTDASPGDDIGFPPGVYQITGTVFPADAPNAIRFTSVNTSTGTFTISGSAPANGTQVMFASAYSPINDGVIYYVVGSSGSTFQVSLQSGGTAIPLAACTPGTTCPYQSEFITVANLTSQAWVTVHSTAASSLLPPTGVRLGQDAAGNSNLAQYLPNMAVFQEMDVAYQPISMSDFANSNGFQNHLYFTNVGFSTDPTVATSGSLSVVDPVGFRVPFAVGGDYTSAYIVYNQCAFIPALPPSRSALGPLIGQNISVVNSTISGLDWWQPLRTGTPTSGAGTATVTISPFTYYWVGTGGSVGTANSCTFAGGTITASGTGNGYYSVWINPSTCVATGRYSNTSGTVTSSGLTLTSTADSSQDIIYEGNYGTAPYPSGTYTPPLSSAVTENLDINVVGGHIYNGTILSASDWSPETGPYNQSIGQSGGGLYIQQGLGPFTLSNNYQVGAGIGGWIGSVDDDTINATPCGQTFPCVKAQNNGDMVDTRSTVGTNPCYLANTSNPCWNGGRYYWRNLSETKQFSRVLQDGDIFGPWGSDVGDGMCMLHQALSAGYTANTGIPYLASWFDSSNWLFQNNSCINTPAGPQGGSCCANEGVGPPPPVSNFLLRNNIFRNNNGWVGVGNITPFDAHYQYDDSGAHSCPDGFQSGLGDKMQNLIFDHNTWYGSAGCVTNWEYINGYLSAGIQFTNNFLNVTGDHNFSPTYGYNGVWYEAANDVPQLCLNGSGGLSAPGNGGSMITPPCMVGFGLTNNVMMATWANSFPGNIIEYNTSDVSTITGQLGSPWTSQNWFPNQSTLAARWASVGFLNPSLGNFRLTNLSVYQSGGANHATDGLAIGADQDQIDVHQGNVSNVRAIVVTTTTALIGFLAPDSFGCTVDVGTQQFWTGTGTWMRFMNSGGTRVQNVTLTGLNPGTVYYYKVNCAASQPTGTFTTQTLSQAFNGVSHYVSTSGSSGHGGTNPTTDAWDLATACGGTSAIHAGDTVWLVGGTYNSVQAATTLVNGTSYSIITVGTTDFTLIGAASNTPGVIFTASGAGTGTGTATPSNGVECVVLNGTATHPVRFRNYSNQRATVDGGIIYDNPNQLWWGIEVINSSCVRTGASPVAGTGCNDGFHASTLYGEQANVKFVNGVVHDTLDGITSQQNSTAFESYGNTLYSTGEYNPSDTRGHGHCIYFQEALDDPIVKWSQEDLCWNAFSAGIQFYGQSVDTRHLWALGSLAFMNGQPFAHLEDQYVVDGGSDPKDDINLNTIFTYTPTTIPGTGFPGYSVFGSTGSYSGDLGLTIQNSWLSGPKGPYAGSYWSALVQNWNNVVFTGNTVVGPAQATNIQQQDNWGSNTYINNPTVTPPAWDVSSTTSTTFPPTTQSVFVRPNKYEPGRCNVIVFNYPLTTTFSFNPGTACSLPNGPYTLRDVQNFYGTPIASGTYSGGSLTVTIPTTGATVSAFGGINPPSAVSHTSNEFGAFVLTPY